MSKKRQSSRDWSKQFDIVYSFFCSSAYGLGLKATNRDFRAYLNISAGKFQNWTNGQWPSAEDLQILHEKFGFSYDWLVSGEGEPFEVVLSTPEPPETQAELSRLRAELEEERRINRQLVTKLLVDGAGDKGAQTNIARTADGA